MFFVNIFFYVYEHAFYERVFSCGNGCILTELRIVVGCGWTISVKQPVYRAGSAASVIMVTLLFIDLADHYGVTQCVTDSSSSLFSQIEMIRPESVITVTGNVVARDAETVNTAIPTGQVELRIDHYVLENAAEILPFQIAVEDDAPEDIRLRHRYLDLRRENLHRRILLRSRVISSIRRRMTEQGFTEIQTPILTAGSPEGARDYLVPSRLHPGQFYALPQAPQIFKQLLMVGGFDKYFQIAPCFRDEDARSDRSPGEFYQLDLEMAFAEQEDVFAALEPVLFGVFEEFANGRTVTPPPFLRLSYDEAILSYGSDKPDLRNPLKIKDVTAAFRDSGFQIFARAISTGAVVRAIPAPAAAGRPRSWFDKLNDWARDQGQAGLGYIIFSREGGKGPIAKNLDENRLDQLRQDMGLAEDDALFLCVVHHWRRLLLLVWYANVSVMIWDCVKRVFSVFAGLSIFRCLSVILRVGESISAIIRSQCRKVGWILYTIRIP